jgi:hypothetical protein
MTNDQGGDTFVNRVRDRVDKLGYHGEDFRLNMPDGFKDVSDLYRDDPDQFLTIAVCNFLKPRGRRSRGLGVRG